MLEQHRRAFDAVAAALIEHETLSGEQIDEIVTRHEDDPPPTEVHSCTTGPLALSPHGGGAHAAR